MIILGLTGSIGMGKSTAAAMFRRLAVPVFDADACVHGLQAPGGAALPRIAQLFPGTVTPAGLDRAKLRAVVFAHPAALEKLEAIMHPLVRQAQRRWLQIQALQRHPLVVLDIPLLFEKGGWRGCDVIAVVTAPDHVHRSRVLSRPGMTPAAFAAIKSSQLPDNFKCQHASFLIRSGQGRHRALQDVKQIIRCARQLVARKYPAGRAGNRRAPCKRKA